MDGYHSNSSTTPAFPQEALEIGDISIIGMKGSGKTHGARTLIEQLVGAGRMVIIFDPTGAWRGAAVATDGGPGLPVVIIGGDQEAHIKLAFGRGKVTAEFLHASKVSAVIDLKFLDNFRFEIFVTDFLSTLFALQMVSPEALWLVLDEADRFAPQTGRTAEQKKLQAIVEGVAMRGRIAGIRLITITTRLAKLSKSVVSEADTIVGMRLPGTQDREALSKWMDGRAGNGPEIRKTLASLKLGEGWVSSIHRPAPFRMTFPPITTRDTSATPAAPAPTAPNALDQSRLAELIVEFEKLAHEEEPAEVTLGETHRSDILPGAADDYSGVAANAVRKLRVETMGMSSTAFAQHIGMAPQNLAGLEKGTRPPTVKTLEHIAVRCGVRLQVAFRQITTTDGNIVRLPARQATLDEQSRVLTAEPADNNPRDAG
jgi:transcriptional regulator with XRE-family HTH domain